MCCASVCVHACVYSLCRLDLWIIFCVFLQENRWDHKGQMTVRERDEIENENERQTLSKHGRKTRRQEHPYLLRRGWDSQTEGQVCLLLAWSVTPCHSMCYVDSLLRMVVGRTTQEAFVCQNTSVLLCVNLKGRYIEMSWASECLFRSTK